MKKIVCYVSVALMLLIAVNASAVQVLIGDQDGFGFDPDKVPDLVGVDKKPVDRKNVNKKLQFEEVLPDMNKNGKIGLRGGDNWDNRSEAEKADTAGAQWTDVTLSGTFIPPAPGLAKDVVFTFTFAPPTKTDPGYEKDHVLSLVYADYDVKPMSVVIDGTQVELVPYADIGLVNGGIGSAAVTVPWKNVEDGTVIVTLIAPNEPYVAFDFAALDTARVELETYPLCVDQEIPIGTYYILPTEVAKSTLDKALWDKGIKGTVFNPRKAACTPKATGKGEPGHYLHCSDTMIETGDYFAFPEEMVTEIEKALEAKKSKEGLLMFSIVSTDPKDCFSKLEGEKKCYCPSDDKKCYCECDCKTPGSIQAPAQ